MIEQQAREWHSNGYSHALDNTQTYERARQSACSKAIVSWNARFNAHEVPNQLGEALNSVGATITFMNLSNIADYQQTGFHDGAAMAESLSILPTSEYAPILTTSFRQPYKPLALTSQPGLAATGPFFGLNNLAQEGGRAEGSNRTLATAGGRSLGPISVRNTISFLPTKRAALT
jgi:hypothetical protein